MKTALMLIDIQNDYFPQGAMEFEGSLEAGRHAYTRQPSLGAAPEPRGGGCGFT